MWRRGGVDKGKRGALRPFAAGRPFMYWPMKDYSPLDHDYSRSVVFLQAIKARPVNSDSFEPELVQCASGKPVDFKTVLCG